jgi:hypothetical protein
MVYIFHGGIFARKLQLGLTGSPHWLLNVQYKKSSNLFPENTPKDASRAIRQRIGVPKESHKGHRGQRRSPRFLKLSLSKKLGLPRVWVDSEHRVNNLRDLL